MSSRYRAADMTMSVRTTVIFTLSLRPVSWDELKDAGIEKEDGRRVLELELEVSEVALELAEMSGLLRGKEGFTTLEFRL